MCSEPKIDTLFMSALIVLCVVLKHLFVLINNVLSTKIMIVVNDSSKNKESNFLLNRLTIAMNLWYQDKSITCRRHVYSGLPFSQYLYIH